MMIALLRDGAESTYSRVSDSNARCTVETEQDGLHRKLNWMVRAWLRQSNRDDAKLLAVHGPAAIMSQARASGFKHIHFLCLSSQLIIPRTHAGSIRFSCC